MEASHLGHLVESARPMCSLHIQSLLVDQGPTLPTMSWCYQDHIWQVDLLVVPSLVEIPPLVLMLS